MKKERTSRSVAFMLAVLVCFSVLFTGILGMSTVLAAPKDAVTNGSLENYTKSDSIIGGWKLEEGYSATKNAGEVYAGDMALKHTGAKSTATSETFKLRDGGRYIVNAYVKKTSDADSAKIKFGDAEKELTVNGAYTLVTFEATAVGTSGSITVEAQGDVLIDNVELIPVYIGDSPELLSNGTFDKNADGWGLNNLAWDGSEIAGRKGTLKLVNPSFALASHADVSVKKNTWYMYSADFYRENEDGSWLYVDNNDIQGEVQLRGTKGQEWQTVMGLWNSGGRTGMPIRIVCEGNWDDPFNNGGYKGLVWVDNISVKEVNVGEDLVENGGFEADSWKLGTGASIQEGDWYLNGSKSLKLENDASAQANGGKTIAVEPDSTYFLHGYRLRVTKDKSVDAKISLRDKTGATEFLSIVGTRYNQQNWKPAGGTDILGNWEEICGLWDSGDNTEVTLFAESTGTGIVYYDDISLRKIEKFVYGENEFAKGNIEEYIGDYNLEGGWLLGYGTELDKNLAYDGSVSAKLNDSKLYYNGANVEKFKEYYLTTYVYKDSADATLTINVNGTKKIVDASVNAGEWTKVSYLVTSLASKKMDVTIASTGTVHVDSLSIIPVKQSELQETKTYISDLEYTGYRIEGTSKPWLDHDTSANGKINIGSLGTFDKGVRTHPGADYDAWVTYDLTQGNYNSFRAWVGRDGNNQPPSGCLTQFMVYVDGVLKDSSPKMQYNEVYWFNIDVTGASELKIYQTDGGDGYPYDGGSWAEAALYSIASEGYVTIETPAASMVTDHEYIPTEVTITGSALADSVNVYVNDTLYKKIDLDGYTYECDVTGLADGKNTIAVKSVVGGTEKETAELTVNRPDGLVNIGDAYWSRMTANSIGSIFRNRSLHGKLSVAGGTYTSDYGFETHPKAGKIEDSYADIDVPITGSGYRYFQTLVGLNSQQGGESRRNVTCKVLVDGVELASSGLLAGNDIAFLTAEIPADAKLLTLRVDNGDGDYAYSATDWLYPVLANDKNDIYKHYVNLYDENAESKSVDIDGANAQLIALEDFNAINILTDDLDGEVSYTLYSWNYSYERTLETAPVATGAGTAENGAAFIPLYGNLSAGEYLLVLNGKGTIKSYASDKAIRYADTFAAEALKVQFVFAEEATEYFGNPTACVSETTDADPTASEIQRVGTEYRSFMANDLRNFPVSFKIDGTQYNGFGTDFERVTQNVTVNNGNETTVTKLKHTSGLIFEVKSVYYPSYNAYDWTIYIKNEGTDNSPVVSDVNAADLTYEGEKPYLMGNYGDSQQYKPYTVAINGKHTSAPAGGRGTQGDSSYFNLEYGNKGVLYAVGWPGQWTMSLDNSGNASETRLTAGQETFNSYLKPGEIVRTPLMAFVNYDGRSQTRATNLWRRWMIDCNLHRITEDETGVGEKELMAPARFAATSIQYAEMTLATDENQIAAIDYYLKNDIDLTFWWMDAGWYYTLDGSGNLTSLAPGNWPQTGVWMVDKDRFPSGMKAISDFAGKNGIKTLLWFEPERVLMDLNKLKTDGTTVKADWLLAGNLVNMGIPEAEEWIANRVIGIMREGGISMYREDFNIMPLGNWQAGDNTEGANRNGITENLYIQGHLRLWDTILGEFPNATIDSCASGGNRNDLETMRRGVPLHKTDYAYGDHTAQQAIALEMSRWIPYYGTKANGDDATTRAQKYALRTAMASAMVLGYNADAAIDWDIVRDITLEHEDVTQYNYGDYYTLTSWSRNENSWIGWEYFTKSVKQGYAMVFRRSSSPTTQVIKLKGLDADKNYQIWFEDADDYAIYSGSELMKKGLKISLPADNTSDIIHIAEEGVKVVRRALIASITKTSVDGQHSDAVRTEGEYSRFDVRFNMSLRNTILGNGKGTIEKGVQNDYKDSVLINVGNGRAAGKTVGELLAEDPAAVKMDYDVENNILRVYVKNTLMTSEDDAAVTLKSNFATDDGIKQTGNAGFDYNAADKAWSAREIEPAKLATDIKLTYKNEMTAGETQTIGAVVKPDDADDKSVTFESSDTDILTVDENGVVTAVAAGKATVKVTAKDGSGVFAVATINVKLPSGIRVPVSSITVTGKANVGVSKTTRLTAKVLPDNATVKGVKWVSSDETIAKVDANGVVTGIKAGKAVIKAIATDGTGVYGEITITVTDGANVNGGNRTGDNASVALYLVMILIGISGLVTLVLKRRSVIK